MTLDEVDLNSLWAVLESGADLARRGTGVRYRIDTLVAIDRWARRHLGITEGDRVVIIDAPVIDHTTSPGWFPWRDIIINGSTGEARGVHFNSHVDAWQVAVHLDRDIEPNRVFTLTLHRLARLP